MRPSSNKTLLLGLLALVHSPGCGNTPPPPPFTQPGQPATPAAAAPTPSVAPANTWVGLNETTACASGTAPSSCLGLYGFSVDNAGNYTVGPSPNNEVISGIVTSTELNQLNQDATAVATSNLLGPAPVCAAINTAAMGTGLTSDRLDLTLASMDDVTVYDASVLQLHTDFQGFLQKYYVMPFPTADGPSPAAP